MTFARLRTRSLTTLLTAATVAMAIATPLTGQAQAAPDQKDPRIGALIAMLDRTRTPLEATISPDGTIVAWSLKTSEGTQIHLSDAVNADPAKEQIVTTGNGATSCGNRAPKWSPSGEQLAFISTCTAKDDQPGQEQLFVWSNKTGESKQLTHVTGGIDELDWSPDGQRIGFLFVENATRSAGALAAMKPWAGVIGEDGVEIQRVGIVDVPSASFSQVTPANLHVYEFSWSPTSKQIVYVAAPPPGENTWWIAQLYTEDLNVLLESAGAKGEIKKLYGSPKSILDTQKITGPLHGLQIAVPRYSPDGTQIAFIGGLMSDQGATGGDVYVMPSSGGQPKNVTPGRATSVAWITWTDDQSIGIAEFVGGSSHLALLDLATDKDTPGVDFSYPESIGSGGLEMAISLAAQTNDVAAFIRRSYDHPPEVWAGHLDNLHQITHLNDDLKPLWGKSESIEWTNEGFKVQGWLLYPANYDPAKKYPLLVSVHGGPSSAVTPHWPGVGYGSIPFSALGYFVFMPNPRGSYGQGEKFTQANIKDFGYGDLRDILTGMDVLEKRFPIDKTREGLTGWSYGGFMTMSTFTQNTRFRAAVAGAGISDWKSYYG